jgi:hypothetical protein
VPVYIRDISLRENINAIDLKEDTEIVSEATAKIVMYMRMRRHLKSRQNHNIVAYLPGNATNNL